MQAGVSLFCSSMSPQHLKQGGAHGRHLKHVYGRKEGRDGGEKHFLPTLPFCPLGPSGPGWPKSPGIPMGTQEYLSPIFRREPGSQNRGAHTTSPAIRGHAPGVPGTPRSPAGTEVRERSQPGDIGKDLKELLVASVGLPNVVNENTGRSVRCEPQINIEYIFSVGMFHVAFGAHAQ